MPVVYTQNCCTNMKQVKVAHLDSLIELSWRPHCSWHLALASQANKSSETTLKYTQRLKNKILHLRIVKSHHCCHSPSTRGLMALAALFSPPRVSNTHKAAAASPAKVY